MGTSVGTQVFNNHGWRPAAALSVGWTGFCLIVMLLRGPHCARYTWFGYEGGLELRKSRLAPLEPTPVLEMEKVDASKEGSIKAGEDAVVKPVEV